MTNVEETLLQETNKLAVNWIPPQLTILVLTSGTESGADSVLESDDGYFSS